MAGFAAVPHPAKCRRKLLWLPPAGAPPDVAPPGLAGSYIDVALAQDAIEVLSTIRSHACDGVVLSLPIAGWTCAQVVEEALRISPDLLIVVQGALDEPEATCLIKLGVFDIWHAPLDPSGIAGGWARAWEAREAQVAGRRALAVSEPWRKMLLGESPVMGRVTDIIRLIGPRRSTVLVTGETGTGKEMVARAIHMASPRSQFSMVAVNCGAIPEALLEAELFGHVKGAFTGATQNRVGRFEQAHRGTLFLDEIAELPLELQTKLLRVLQEREFQRVGSSETVQVDVRVVAACNVDLPERVRQGRFREDLYYRINVVPITLPPLRERGRDIAILARHFAAKICRQEGIPEKELSAAALDHLHRFHWPGNVRQLENAIEMAVALSGDRLLLHPDDFPLTPAIATRTHGPIRSAAPALLPDGGLDYEQAVGRFELGILEQALRRTNGNKTLAADLLRLKRTTLTAKLKTLESQARSWA